MTNVTDSDDSNKRLVRFFTECLEAERTGLRTAIDHIMHCPEGLQPQLQDLISSHQELGIQNPREDFLDDDEPGLENGQIVGKIKICNLICRGGMGRVYRGYDGSLGRQVAVKILNSVRSDGVLEKELTALAQLEHESIVRVHTSENTEQGILCAVMEFVDSGDGNAFSLKDLLKHRRILRDMPDIGPKQHRPIAELSATLGISLSPQFIAGQFSQVARALAYAHECGILHRDIKPANLLLKSTSKNGAKFRLMVADWGLAKIQRNGSSMTVGPGTQHYRAPEMEDPELSKNADSRCDVFSFGVTLYETLTLELPEFDSKPIAARLPPVLGIDADLDAICSRCLEPDMGNRIRDLTIVADALDRYSRGEPIEFRSLSGFQRQIRRFRLSLYHHRVVTAVVTLTIAALVVASFLWNPRSESSDSLSVLARTAWALKDLPETERLLNKLIRDGYPSAADFDLRSQVLISQQRFRETLDDCNTAIAMGAGVSTQVRRARCRTYLGEWELALEEVNALVRDNPRDSTCLLERAEIQAYLKNWSTCRADFQKLITEFGDTEFSLYAIAFACAADGDDDACLKASRAYRDAQWPTTNSVRVLSACIVCSVSEQLTPEEYKQLLEAFQRSGPHSDYFLQLVPGIMLTRLQKFDDAIPYLKEASRRQQHGGTPIEWSYLAMCQIAKSEKSQAEISLKNAKQALARSTRSFPRALVDMDLRAGQIGEPIFWHHFAANQLSVMEAERKLAAMPQD